MDGQAPERALDAALSAIPKPTAAADFRARLREAFVAGELEGKDGKDAVTSETLMSQSETVIDLDPALDAVQHPAARSAFRRELREQFLGAGEAASASTHKRVTKAAGGPRASRARREPASDGSRVPRGARKQRRQTWAMGASALVVAAALVITFVLRPPVPVSDGWQLRPIASAPASDQFQVDGVAYVPGQDLAQADLITAGSEALRLQFCNQLVVDLEPGSSLDISGTRGTGDIVLAMAGERGGYRVATLASFDSTQRRLLFQTPDAEVEVRGTVFGIDRYQDDKPGGSGTCICCCKGEVQVRARDGAAKSAVSEGQSSYVVAGVGEINPMDMPHAHAAPLDQMAAQIY